MSSSSLVVHVPLGKRSYEIQIGTGILGSLGSIARRLCPLTHAVVITDHNVTPHAERVAGSLGAAGVDVAVLTLAAGEGSKSAAAAATLWEQMLTAGTDRYTVVFAVGGGVVGDLAGFAAATFARGLTLIQVPTTLLAQVDSSVGGKTGINLSTAKNMVGAFWQPRAVCIDTQVLATLPDREYRSGLAEVVKYGVILDAEFFSYLEQHVQQVLRRDDRVLRQVIARCCRLKAEVVAADEREQTGLRAVLNYGHTFGHALEAVSGYGQLLHGEAISIGMLCASRLAESLQRIESEVTHRQQELLLAIDLPVALPQVDRDRLIALMQHDKKARHGKLRFVLPTRMGHAQLVDDVDESLVRHVLSSSG